MSISPTDMPASVHLDSRIPSLVQFADAGIGDIAVGEIAERFCAISLA